MATFKVCVKAKRKDGFYPVYIRVIHHKMAYMPTDKMVNDKGLTKTGEIDDPYVLQFCTNRIVEYMEVVLSKVDTESWTVKDIVDYLKSGYNDICFSDYARKHIDRMIVKGEQRNAKNYELALHHMGGVSISEVVFAMNHSSGYRVTRGCIKLDFTRHGF